MHGGYSNRWVWLLPNNHCVTSSAGCRGSNWAAGVMHAVSSTTSHSSGTAGWQVSATETAKGCCLCRLLCACSLLLLDHCNAAGC